MQKLLDSGLCTLVVTNPALSAVSFTLAMLLHITTCVDVIVTELTVKLSLGEPRIVLQLQV